MSNARSIPSPRTEVGPPAQARFAAVDGLNEDWEYVEMPDAIDMHREYLDGVPGVFELMILVRFVP